MIPYSHSPNDHCDPSGLPTTRPFFRIGSSTSTAVLVDAKAMPLESVAPASRILSQDRERDSFRELEQTVRLNELRPRCKSFQNAECKISFLLTFCRPWSRSNSLSCEGRACLGTGRKNSYGELSSIQELRPLVLTLPSFSKLLAEIRPGLPFTGGRLPRSGKEPIIMERKPVFSSLDLDSLLW
jgi:hypothetical protein